MQLAVAHLLAGGAPGRPGGGRLGGLQGAARRTGTVELGYGLGEAHRGRGYMTEAAEALCGWALSRPGVNRVTAETEPDNAASQRVLGRCGFSRFRELPGSVWWELPGGGGARG
ncbi:MAG: GNAT family N-acetyltransferase [Anaerotruncus massiliensis (ex Togo et al. 2019)]